MNKVFFLIMAACLSTMFIISCSKSSTEQNNDSDDSGATKDCVLGYGMPTQYDIIPSDEMESLINEMCSFASDVAKAKNLRDLNIPVTSNDMDTYLGGRWVSAGSLDCPMDICCYRIVDKHTLKRYDIRITTTKPADSDFVITNDSDWFFICDHSNNEKMQNNIYDITTVYFYKTNEETRTVNYIISELDSPKGYYIWADSYGDHMAYFEWWSNTGYWYCEKYYF